VSGLAGSNRSIHLALAVSMPPLPVKSRACFSSAAHRKLGLHPFPAPMPSTRDRSRRAPCIHCGFCHGFACEVQAKSSTLFNMIPEAEATGRCEVRANSYVVRIGTNARGRAQASLLRQKRRERFQRPGLSCVG